MSVLSQRGGNSSITFLYLQRTAKKETRVKMWTGEAILKGAAERSRVMAECSAYMYVRMRERETNLVSPSLHSCSGSQREHEAFHWTCGEEVCPLQTRRKQCTEKTCHLPPTTHTHTHTISQPVMATLKASSSAQTRYSSILFLFYLPFQNPWYPFVSVLV